MATPGKIAKFDPTGNVTDSIISETNAGSIGIGTPNPSKPLTIQAQRAGQELIGFQDPSGATKWHINQNLGGANPGLNFVESGVADARLFLKAGGNVGIGTPAPSVKTQIEGTEDQGATLAIRRSDNNKFMRLGVGGQGVALDFDPTSFLVIQKNTLGIDGVLAGQELLRVTADGHVGIGTAAPTAKAEIRVANEGDWALKLQSGPNDFFDVRPTNVGGRFQTELNTANNRDLVILPGTGNVLIGTTAPSTSARLTVEAIGPDSGDFTFAAGVVGRATNPTGVPGLFRQTAGVRGINDDGHGVQGQSDSHIGVEGTSNSGTAVFAQSDSGVGIFGVTNSGPFAGFFRGPVQVVGTLTKSGGGFRIDHPLDSANKYMNHSFVESPEMKNVYDGAAVLDANGEAAVMLPDWFEALNEGFRYQLTPVGAPAPQLHIANEIADAQFRIAGGVPGQRVCWQVTGVRKDPWARAHPVMVEEPKTDDERGRYLDPELFGQGEDQSIMGVKTRKC